MKLLGTIVNGRVELGTPADLPDGTRVVSLEAEKFEDFEDEEVYEYPHSLGSLRPRERNCPAARTDRRAGCRSSWIVGR